MTDLNRVEIKGAKFVMLAAMIGFSLIFLAARSLSNTAATQVHSEACALAFQEGGVMRVLVGCEQSGTVRDAFLAEGHDAWSCDVLPAETPSNRHIIGDVRDVMNWGDWDMLCVMHPPCTRLCNSGVRWLHQAPPGKTLEQMWRELDEGASLFSDCWNADIPMVAAENPVMHKYAKARIRNFQPHSQSVQPWQFGVDTDGPDNEKKRTCLWLRGLPTLTPTGSLDGSTARDSVHKASPGKDRRKERSRFFPGIAKAMAQQWGQHALKVAA